MTTRRDLLQGIGGAALAAYSMKPGSALANDKGITFSDALPAGVKDNATLEAYPGKAPLIKLSYRPPNYETPVSYFDTVITPNDAFFVRYHLADIPEKIDAAAFRLTIGGEVEKSLELSLDELKAMPAQEVTAVCQCSGNRRGMFAPHVTGVQWGYGAMGNAKWKGVRLKDVLANAGVKKDAVEVVLNGLDAPVLDKTPDFVKSIPLWKAQDENVLLAYEMNGQPLPMANGYPLRVVVPGWTATYWMKHVNSIELVSKPFDGFWMQPAYRLPLGKFPVVQRFISQETDVNTPITEMMINSLITAPVNGAALKVGAETTVKGIAWDAGYGIAGVEVSVDGGKTFAAAELGPDEGRFSFRPWTFSFKPSASGPVTIIASARNAIGQTQTTALNPNPGGYHHNLMQHVDVNVA